MSDAKEIYPVDMGRGKGRANPTVRDFRPTVLEETTEPTDVELAMLEEQLTVAQELGVDPDEVNPPSHPEDNPGEADRPRERSKPA